VVCIPTTLSAAEFQPFFGARDPQSRRKEPYAERGLISRTVILDGEAAASTPAGLWAETGVKALDDAFSRYCNAESEEPAADAAQAQAIAGLMGGLAAGARGGAVERQANLVDVWLTTHPLPRHRPAARKAWFSAVFRHALGGAVEAPHGAASCIALPQALRFHASTWPRQAKLAAVLGLEPGPAGDAPLAEPVARLLADLAVPTRIRDLGVERAALDRVVENMLFEQPRLGAPEEIRAACERLW
jgi:maleylacetate reductase